MFFFYFFHWFFMFFHVFLIPISVSIFIFIFDGKRSPKWPPKLTKKATFFPKRGADPNIQLRIKRFFFFTFFWTSIFWIFGALLAPFWPRLGPLGHILAPRGGHFGAPGTILETIFEDVLWFFNRWFWDYFLSFFNVFFMFFSFLKLKKIENVVKRENQTQCSGSSNQ